jgi:hypothetical protein
MISICLLAQTPNILQVSLQVYNGRSRRKSIWARSFRRRFPLARLNRRTTGVSWRTKWVSERPCNASPCCGHFSNNRLDLENQVLRSALLHVLQVWSEIGQMNSVRSPSLITCVLFVTFWTIAQRNGSEKMLLAVFPLMVREPRSR